MRRRPFSPYAHYRLRDANGNDAGVIRDGVYKGADFKLTPLTPWDGIVYSVDRDPPELYERSDRVGVILGTRLVFDSGEVLRLVPMLRGEDLHRAPRIEDADQFRALLIAQELAEDEGDRERAAGIGRRLDLAAFYECPRCHNDATDREACALCQGDGFVWEGIEDGE
ncbi:hypothetical protein [Pseudomonas nitroreducens]|uniref:hypothetical protein n=1 Tax=Pseudomonas nitroreducens TaxID=46680 RepID=UPI002657F459|nr:hypothetical protein [Pseudomonas nitroreducens]MCP1652714.1 hypothetical protein [Pseudomonas nitroreducens]